MEPVLLKDLLDVVPETVPVLLKDLFDEDSSSSSTSTHLSQTLDDNIMIQKQGLMKSLLKEDNECSLLSSHHMYGGGFNNRDCYRENETSTVQVVTDDEIDGILLSNNGCSHISSSDIENEVDMIENFGHYIPISEQESRDQRVPIQMSRENDENEVLRTSQQLQKDKRRSLHKITSQRALSMDTTIQEDFTTFLLESQHGNTQDSGRGGLVSQGVKSLCASVLLGLGFQNLGLDHDFFYGLML